MAEIVQYELGDFYTVRDAVLADALFTNWSESELLSFKGGSEFSNLDRIYLAYGPVEKEELKTDYELQKLLVESGGVVVWEHNYRIGTIILVPSDKINRTIAARSGGRQIVDESTVEGTIDIDYFLGSELEKMIDSKTFIKSEYIFEHSSGERVKKSHPNCIVHMWVRSLSTDDDKEMSGEWVNVTPFVDSVETHTDNNGGNFSLSFSQVNAFYNEDTQKWELSKDTVNQSSFTSNLERSKFFFHHAINQNDLVTIRFELTDTELFIRNKYKDETVYPDSFDMIGLVDSVSIGTSANNDISIEIRGRDLSKLLIDDACYMYPLLFTEQQFIHKDSPLVKRNSLTNAYDFYAVWKYHSLKDSVQFIINVLSNIRVVPDSALYNIVTKSAPIKSVEERRDPLLLEQVSKKDGEAIELLTEEYLVNVNKKIGTETEDEYINILETRTLLDDFVIPKVSEDSSVVTIQYSEYSSIVESRLKISSDVVIETVVGQGVTVLGPRRVARAVVSLYLKEKLFRSNPPKKTFVSNGGGIWSLVQLAFDEQIANRRLADTSLGQPDSSLLNLMWNYAQWPFIEFFMDTYNYSFNLIFRRPPLDGPAINRYIQKGILDKLIVEEADVLSESLSFDETVYSLYELDYKSVNLGGDNSLWGFVPAVPFSDIAEIYGNKRLKLSTNLISINDTKGREYFPMLSELRNQAYQDLKFMIDIHSYLQFTRKGTITINGDRRFKKGMWFWYKPTNEIFYIDSVSNSQSISEGQIERTTVLGVSRGMVKTYVTGEKTIVVDGKKVPLTYFNIINTEQIIDFFKEKFAENNKNLKVNLTTKSSTNVFQVQRPIFNFFFKKKQFIVDKPNIDASNNRSTDPVV